jgi:hypothetical protein
MLAALRAVLLNLTIFWTGHNHMSDQNENVPTVDYMIAACAIAAAIVPFASLFPFRLNWTTLFDWLVNLLCVAAFYVGSRRLLQRLTDLEMLEPDTDGTFHRIRTSVARLSLVGLSTMTVAWLISDYIGR